MFLSYPFSQKEIQDLYRENQNIITTAKHYGYETIDTFSITMGRYKEFLQGRCACHFHEVSQLYISFNNTFIEPSKSSSLWGSLTYNSGSFSQRDPTRSSYQRTNSSINETNKIKPAVSAGPTTSTSCCKNQPFICIFTSNHPGWERMCNWVFTGS